MIQEWELQLQNVNLQVNQFDYLSDPLRYKMDDFWTEINSGGGDCDDYAVAKLRRLVKLGWPIESLHLACCYDETDSYHAVLVVEAPDADYVLDNRFGYPYPVDRMDEIGYRPHIIQAVGGKRSWVEWLPSN